MKSARSLDAVPRAIGMKTTSTTNPDDSASWISQSNGTITGLTTGIRTCVRIWTIGPNGPGPRSDLAGKMVP